MANENEKVLKARTRQKHDIEANWIKAGNASVPFVPLAGEIIVYDKDDTHPKARFKIGDGITNVNELPLSAGQETEIMSVDSLPTENIQEGCIYQIRKAHGVYYFKDSSDVTPWEATAKGTIHYVDTLPEVGIRNQISGSWETSIFHLYKKKGDNERFYYQSDVGNWHGGTCAIFESIEEAKNNGEGFVPESTECNLYVADKSDPFNVRWVHLNKKAISNVTTLPMDDIDEEGFYKTSENFASTYIKHEDGSIEVDSLIGVPVTVHVVDELPTQGEFASDNAEPPTRFIGYYCRSDKMAYAFWDIGNGEFSWIPLQELLVYINLNATWKEIQSVDEVTDINVFYIRLNKNAIFHYDGEWHELVDTIVQTTGESETAVMSQKAATDALLSLKESLEQQIADFSLTSGEGENSIQQDGTNAISKHSVAFGSGTYAGGMGYKVTGIVLDNGIIITQETENPKKIEGTVVGYKLRTVEGLETEMNYSVRLGLAKYHCGTIASIDTTTQQILVNNAPQIKYLNTKQDDPDNDFIGNVLTITGRPELGDVNIAFNSVSFGKDNASMERNTFTAGVDNSAIGSAGAAFGNGNIAGYEAFATGRNNKALGDQSSAFGGHNEVYGAFSQVHGDSNVVYSICASAEGGSNTMNAKYGHVEGYNNIVDEAATGAHVEGHNNTTVVGQYSHVEGSHNAVLAGSEYSHVEGDHNTIGSIYGINVLAAHAEGSETVASASCAHAEGYYTKSTGECAHAEGAYTESTGKCAHSEGNHAVAEGYASHAGGSYTTASRLNSFAHGNYVNATEENSVAFGQHNIPEGRLLSVGDGTEKVPSNAFEVFADGRVGAKTPAKELTDLVQLKQAIVLSRRAVESEEIDPTVMQFKENKNNPFELSVVAASKPKTPLTELHIPAIYNNKVVTSVGESAFKNIKDEGYPYNGLTTLTVAYGVEKIEGYAFEGCKALTYIDLPTTITEIGPMAFKQANIKTLVLPPHIKLISGQAFRGTSIENAVRIPSTCTSIGYASKEAHCGKVFGSKVPAVIFEGVPEKIHKNTFLDNDCDIYVPWSEGEVLNAPWGTTGKIHYRYQMATKDYVDDEIVKSGYTIIKEISPDESGYQFYGVEFNAWYVAVLLDKTQKAPLLLRAYSSTYQEDGALDGACESYIDIEHGEPFQFPTSGWWYCGGSDVAPKVEALDLSYCWDMSDSQVVKLYEVTLKYAPVDAVYTKSEIDNSFATKQEVNAVYRHDITLMGGFDFYDTTGYMACTVYSRSNTPWSYNGIGCNLTGRTTATGIINIEGTEYNIVGLEKGDESISYYICYAKRGKEEFDGKQKDSYIVEKFNFYDGYGTFTDTVTQMI